MAPDPPRGSTLGAEAQTALRCNSKVSGLPGQAPSAQETLRIAVGAPRPCAVRTANCKPAAHPEVQRLALPSTDSLKRQVWPCRNKRVIPPPKPQALLAWAQVA